MGAPRVAQWTRTSLCPETQIFSRCWTNAGPPSMTCLRHPSKHEAWNHVVSMKRAGPTLKQHWFSASCLLGIPPLNQHHHTPKWFYCLFYSSCVQGVLVFPLHPARYEPVSTYLGPHSRRTHVPLVRHPPSSDIKANRNAPAIRRHRLAWEDQAKWQLLEAMRELGQRCSNIVIA